MTRSRLATLLVAFALTAIGRSPASAADLRNVLTGYTLTAWSQKDGLPSGTVYALAQDREGYLWVGTNAGLFRFDGLRFISWDTFGSTPLPQTAVRALLATADGSVWVGFGDGGGISRIRRGRVRTYTDADGLRPGAVSAIVEDGSGRVWAGNADGLFALHGDRWDAWPAGRGLPKGGVLSLYAARDGRFIVGAASGVYALARGGDSFERMESADPEPPRSLAEDASGNLCITDPIAGFRRIGEPSAAADRVERGRGRRLLFDSRGNLWVGTAGQGLWRVHKDNAQPVLATERATALTGLLADGVISLLEDREGNIWAGTTEGLNRLTPHRVTQITTLGLVAGVEVTPDGLVWVGTVDAIARFSARATGLTPLRTPLRNNPLRAIHADSDGTVWIATNGYVARVAAGRDALVPLAGAQGLHQVEAITSDARDGVWMYDLEHGLVHWNGGRQQPFALPPGLDQARVVTLYTDRSARIWVAFAQGQLAAISPDGSIRTYTAQDGFDAGVCHAMYEDTQGVVWFAGTDGLSRFADEHFVTVHQGNGFPTDNLTAVVEDDAGNLWIGTGLGIVRLHRGEFEKAIASRSYRVRYNLYDRSDGLAGLPFTYSSNRRAVRAKDGRLWFVTGRGLTIIDPRALRDTPPPAPVRIETIYADDRKVDPAARPALAPRTSRIEIDYTVLNLTSPLKTRFRYQLEGFDASWIDAGARRQAFYTNLPPRRYRFRVMASSSEGEWNEPGDLLEFSIQPMFYQTAWFYALAVTALGLAIWGAWVLRLRQVRRQFSMLIGERARLSREIHDTLLQSLVGVALQFDSIANDLESLSPKAKHRFVRMRKQVEEYIREARQSIWDLRSPKLQRADLVTALRETCEQVAGDGGVVLDFAVTGTPHRCPPKIEEQILRIGQEAVTNAVRHARPTQVRIELAYAGDALKLRVADDGLGFDPQETHTDHYGLVSMRERTQDVGGAFAITSRAGRGTEVEAVIPLAESA